MLLGGASGRVGAMGLMGLGGFAVGRTGAWFGWAPTGALIDAVTRKGMARRRMGTPDRDGIIIGSALRQSKRAASRVCGVEPTGGL